MEREKGGIPGPGLLGSCSLPGEFAFKTERYKTQPLLLVCACVSFLERESRSGGDGAEAAPGEPVAAPRALLLPPTLQTGPALVARKEDCVPGEARTARDEFCGLFSLPQSGLYVSELACMWQKPREATVICQEMKACKLSSS